MTSQVKMGLIIVGAEFNFRRIMASADLFTLRKSALRGFAAADPRGGETPEAAKCFLFCMWVCVCFPLELLVLPLECAELKPFIFRKKEREGRKRMRDRERERKREREKKK